MHTRYLGVLAAEILRAHAFPIETRVQLIFRNFYDSNAMQVQFVITCIFLLAF